MVSVVIPTYNRAHFIGETLKSIQAQSYQDWECIVVDDGSVDKTDSIVNEFCVKDGRFSYHKRPSNLKKGANSCRNFGIKLSKGEFIAFCDDDDLWVKNKLSLQMQIFKKIPKTNIVTGNIEFVDSKGNESGRIINHRHNHGYIFEHILLKNRTSMVTPVFRRLVLNKVGFLNEDFHLFEDWQFWIRIAYYYPFYALDHVLAYVRRHDENTYKTKPETAITQYNNYLSIIKSIRMWGKDRFSVNDQRIINRVKVKRCQQILRNHCKEIHQKTLFMVYVFKSDFKVGIRLFLLKLTSLVK